MNIAIIPARGGSKRIPQKNIRPFFGKPMIQYSIEAAIHSGLFDRVIVSTDAAEIAEVARSCGAEVPHLRPGDLADDYTPYIQVVAHALQTYLPSHHSYQYVCAMLATAPFVQVEHIKQGFELIQQHQAASVIPVTSFGFPIFRAFRVTEQERLRMFWPEHELTRSNDLPEAFHDAGQFYWLDIKRFLESRRIFSEDAVPLFLPRYLVQDIDTLEDWQRAEVLYSTLMKGTS